MEKTLTIRLSVGFFLLGPFFLLIERTPADVWLTIVGCLSWGGQSQNVSGLGFLIAGFGH